MNSFIENGDYIGGESGKDGMVCKEKCAYSIASKVQIFHFDLFVSVSSGTTGLSFLQVHYRG